MMINDATVSGQKLHSFALDNLTERMTAREIIRARIWQEVQDYNQQLSGRFNGLVQPTDSERTLNGFKLNHDRKIDWEVQYQRALEAFASNGFFLLVDDRQAETLDEEFTVRVDTEVSFVKLTPLVGG